MKIREKKGGRKKKERDSALASSPGSRKRKVADRLDAQEKTECVRGSLRTWGELG